MFHILYNIAAAGVALGVLIFLHELGHFLVARKIGVGVEIFSLGFGPRIWGLERGGTDYRVSLVPLGGYVKMMGEEPGEDSPQGSPLHFQSRTRWERALILLAGPGSNLVLAFLLIGAAYALGIPEPAFMREPPRIGYVHPDSPARKAGLEPGDLVLAVDGEPMPHWQKLQTHVMLRPGVKMALDYERGGQRASASVTAGETGAYRTGYLGAEPVIPFILAEVTPGSAAEAAGLRAGDRVASVDGEEIYHFARGTEIMRSHAPGDRVVIGVERGGQRLELEAVLGDNEGKGWLGVRAEEPAFKPRRYPLAEIPGAALSWMWQRTGELFTAIGKMFSGILSLRAMSGPVDIAKFSGQMARTGFTAYLAFVAFLSLNLGILNFLPIPVLDGGHLFFLLVEGVRRRDLSMALKERLLQAGLVALLSLMAVIIFLDVLKNI